MTSTAGKQNSRKQNSKKPGRTAKEAAISQNDPPASVLTGTPAEVVRPRRSRASDKTGSHSPKEDKPRKRVAEARSEKEMEMDANAEEFSNTATPKKNKRIRDSYSIPENEHKQISMLKKRCLDQGRRAKKSQILRAGILVLAQMDDTELLAVMERIG
ncbi:hypothetical protein SAMN05216404_10994 [Nitrosospira multiformis]|uniref:Uncharacterized protein n=1 Tax=Nitrosospira multiformis TaxID=1231 RepID=A0A1H8KX47_9PROT|nr:hypothetical protein [Nitrosospira multiformis]SEN97429.1 hypothetical protein SAMN05216404_10994 [Nitrosospira multiformis]